MFGVEQARLAPLIEEGTVKGDVKLVPTGLPTLWSVPMGQFRKNEYRIACLQIQVLPVDVTVTPCSAQKAHHRVAAVDAQRPSRSHPTSVQHAPRDTKTAQRCGNLILVQELMDEYLFLFWGAHTRSYMISTRNSILLGFRLC
jgi:hypothetical protein